MRTRWKFDLSRPSDHICRLSPTLTVMQPGRCGHGCQASTCVRAAMHGLGTHVHPCRSQVGCALDSRPRQVQMLPLRPGEHAHLMGAQVGVHGQAVLAGSQLQAGRACFGEAGRACQQYMPCIQ